MSLIRQMVLADLPIALAINQSNVPAVGAESAASFQELWAISSLALVLELDEQVEGFCIILSPETSYQSPNYLYFQERYRDFIYLDRIALSTKAQNHGFGPLLYREVEKHFQASYFTLEVNIKPPNEGSLRFHLREGFEIVAEEETRPGKVVAMMVKELDH